MSGGKISSSRTYVGVQFVDRARSYHRDRSSNAMDEPPFSRSSDGEPQTRAEGPRVANRSRPRVRALGQRGGERLHGAVAERHPLLGPAREHLVVAGMLARVLDERLRPAPRPVAVAELRVGEEPEERVAVPAP